MTPGIVAVLDDIPERFAMVFQTERCIRYNVSMSQGSFNAYDVSRMPSVAVEDIVFACSYRDYRYVMETLYDNGCAAVRPSVRHANWLLPSAAPN